MVGWHAVENEQRLFFDEFVLRQARKIGDRIVQVDGPVWWFWELELTPHVLKRMVDRQFTEVDLRIMLDVAKRVRENHEEGRYVLETTDGRPWAVIVEPSPSDGVLVVVTAYPVD